MRNLGLLMGFVVIMMITVRLGVVNTNRLISDTNSFAVRNEQLKESREKIELVNTAKKDLYRNPLGYLNTEETLHQPNPLESVDISATISLLGVELRETLFVTSDSGSMLTGILPHSDWKYQPNIVGWGNGIVTLPSDIEEGTEYLLYRLGISEGNTERLEAVYNLDFYTQIPDESYPINLETDVGILVEVKNSAVVAYTILNSEIEEFDYLQVLDLKGKEVVLIEKNSLSETLLIPGTTEYDYTQGHYISLNFDSMNLVRGVILGHSLTRVTIGDLEEEILSSQEDIEIHMDQYDDKLELEIYGTDDIEFEILYETKIK